MMIRAVIIDDEHDGRQALKRALVKYCGEVQIVAIANGPEQGIKVIEDKKPDLVFLDVQMPKMSGFEMLQRLAPIDFEVIFVTSYDHYAIKAIRFSAVDYLLKPIDVDDLIAAVDRTKNETQRKGSSFRYQSVLNNIQYDRGKIKRLAISTLDGIDFFNTDDIIYFQADGNYTTLYFVGHKKQLASKNLKDFQSLLFDSGFCRVHHSFLINMQHVQKYVKGEGGYVILTDNHHVDISRRRKDAFLNTLYRI